MPRAYVPNPGFERQLRGETEFSQGLAKEAEPAARMARSFKHFIMPRKGASGDISVVQDGLRVAIVNPDHGAHLDEFGSKNNAPYAPLRRGATAAGLKFKEAPK